LFPISQDAPDGAGFAGRRRIGYSTPVATIFHDTFRGLGVPLPMPTDTHDDTPARGKKKKPAGLATAEKAALAASWLHEKKGRDIVALDVTGLSPICEAMVAVSAASARQAKALADHVLARCAENGISYLGMEGYRHGQWILVDLNDVLVHVFLEETREFYNIEGLWSEARRIPLSFPGEPERTPQ
jgi:ribosome-associated protein